MSDDPPRWYGHAALPPPPDLRVGDLCWNDDGSVDAWNGHDWERAQPTLDEIVRASRRRALRPILWCSAPGVALALLGSWLHLTVLQWIGWPLLIAALVWSLVLDRQAAARVRESRRRLDESIARLPADGDDGSPRH